MFFLKKKASASPVYFVIGNRRWGTYFLRGVQMAAALRSIGVPAQLVPTKVLYRIKNSILVFVKNLTAEHYAIARQNRNTIIWDILDYQGDLSAHFLHHDMLDGLILSTEASRPSLSSIKRQHDIVIYHHSDPRIERAAQRAQQDTTFNCCYIGNVPQKTHNVSHLDLLPSVTIIETNTRHAERCGWIKHITCFNCHYAIRTDTLQCNTKPLAKVAVAAACNANIIVNSTNAACELLGNDYPFVCAETAQDAVIMLATAREAFGGPLWKKGLERISHLRAKLSITHSAHEYRTFLSHFK